MLRRKVVISIIVTISILIFGGLTLFLTNSNQNGVALNENQYPSPPPKTLNEKINPDIINSDSEWTTNNTHDAEIIKVDDWYYTFSTDYMVAGTPSPGIQIRKSKDMVNWSFVGRVFNSVSMEAAEWTKGGNTFWAPDVIEMDGTFYLYYSVSSFGTRNSYIGLATSDSIEGPWEDQGAVVKTQVGDNKTVNAIDPGIIMDQKGTPWMTYGSYFGGIFIVELDRNTGKLKTPEEEGTLIAQRKNNDYEIEGPAIMYNPDTEMYYLTLSYGFLEDSYNVRVARSANIEGPYLDYNDKNMIDLTEGSFDTGTKIVGAYAFNNDTGWLGTGHNGLIQDGDKYYITHNARAGEDLYWSHLHVREIIWTEDGWPVVSPERYAGNPEKSTEEVTDKNIIGEWEYLTLSRIDDAMATSTNLTLFENGKINEKDGKDYWERSSSNTIKLYWHDNEAPDNYWVDTVTVLPQWDWENWKPTLVFTGLNEEGTAVWGKKISNEIGK
ncbi:arabinan endo-1,5-alpha-L-arabinosidase [Metabacillus crassostreae]|uniref:arabinan endo-1,5-alpha-L-arabinosidase n=1 Tax=Metabacillus crassostreae TaxID=929098 RepID=UPI001959F164|nr:arabinan endo-1,5-alpha-L-arabinosidase [Metabacillus crassostreae]MBM7603839.1 arabinan endo-1,5-alpha-L-arabinosidase [Metabacillus crassostreae]